MRIGVGPVVLPGADRDADIATLAAFYADKVGAHPENATPVRFE